MSLVTKEGSVIPLGMLVEGSASYGTIGRTKVSRRSVSRLVPSSMRVIGFTWTSVPIATVLRWVLLSIGRVLSTHPETFPHDSCFEMICKTFNSHLLCSSV